MTAPIPLTAGVAVPGPDTTRAARLHALAELGAAGWPTRRREQWRYTDLEPLAADDFDLVPGAIGPETVAAAQALLAEASLGGASRQLVLLDGERVPGLGASALAGIEVTGLEARWGEFVASFAKPIGAAAPAHRRPAGLGRLRRTRSLPGCRPPRFGATALGALVSM